MEEFKFEGEWWLPGYKENKVMGVIKSHDKKGLILTLKEPLKDNKINKFFIENIVHGEIKPLGEKFTLTDVFELDDEEFLPNYSYYVRNFFIGDHFIAKNSSQIKFKSMSIRYTRLNNWFGNYLFNNKIDSKSDRISLNFNERVNIEKFKIKDLEVSIDAILNKKEINKPNELILSGDIYINLECKEEMDFGLWIEFIKIIRNFFSFLLMREVNIYGLSGKPSLSKERIPIYIDYLGMTFEKRGEDREEEWGLREIFLDYFEIAEQLETIFKNWIKKINLLSPIISELLFSESHQQAETKFVNLVQALEGFHLRFLNRTPQDDNKFLEKKQSILSKVEKKYRKWLNFRLKYANELTLRERLEDLIKYFPEVLDLKQFEDETLNKIIKYTTSVRNYFTHYDLRLQDYSNNIELMRNGAKFLKLLLYSCVLTELGVNVDEFTKIIRKRKLFMMNYMEIKSFVYRIQNWKDLSKVP